MYRLARGCVPIVAIMLELSPGGWKELSELSGLFGDHHGITTRAITALGTFSTQLCKCELHLPALTPNIEKEAWTRGRAGLRRSF